MANALRLRCPDPVAESTFITRRGFVDFSYTVTDDVDTDGITIPANSIISSATWRTGGAATINRNHSALTNQSGHRVFGTPAYISATSPATLTETNLNGATVSVGLAGLTFASGVSTGSFLLVSTPTIASLSVSSVSGGASGTTSATLTLAFSGNFSAPSTLGVTVRAAAHSGSTDATTGKRVSVMPTDEAPSFGTAPVPAKRV